MEGLGFRAESLDLGIWVQGLPVIGRGVTLAMTFPARLLFGIVLAVIVLCFLGL